MNAEGGLAQRLCLFRGLTRLLHGARLREYIGDIAPLDFSPEFKWGMAIKPTRRLRPHNGGRFGLRLSSVRISKSSRR